MELTYKEIRTKYYEKIYNEAPMIKCECGCGADIKSKDKYGRDVHYINGHNGRKYDDPKQYKREYNHRNRDKSYIRKTKYVHKFKKELIEDAGGCCSLCGLPYDGECSALFDFHHVEPKEKKFAINNASLNRYSRDTIREEASKCVLLCANCHRLLHWDWNINTADSQEEL